jgi:CBS domain-containing protein
VSGLLVADLMTHPVVAVSPGMPFRRLVAVLTEYRLGSVPVVDAHQRPIGVVTETDLLITGGRAPEATANELMTRRAGTVSRDERLAIAARRMIEEKVSRLYVVDGSGRLVGVLTKRDALRVFLPEHQPLEMR